MDENSACCSRSIRPTKGLSPSCSSDSSSVSAKPKPSTTLCAWRRGPLACAENSSIEPIFESLIPYSFTHAREIWWPSLAIFNQAAGGWLRSSKETPNCPFVLCLPVSCLALLFSCIISVPLFVCRIDHTNLHFLVPITFSDHSPDSGPAQSLFFVFLIEIRAGQCYYVAAWCLGRTASSWWS